MSNMLSEGMAFLRDQQKEHLSEDVTYSRPGGPSASGIPAMRGVTNLTITGRDGISKRLRTRDFMVDPADLPAGIMPKKNDQITDSDGVIYQVQNPNGEGAWRYCTGQHKRIRIHTQEIAR